MSSPDGSWLQSALPHVAAEALRPPVGRRPLAHELLAGEEPERVARDANLRRCRGAGPALAPRAVAVRRMPVERAVDLEAHAAAVAARR